MSRQLLMSIEHFLANKLFIMSSRHNALKCQRQKSHVLICSVALRFPFRCWLQIFFFLKRVQHFVCLWLMRLCYHSCRISKFVALVLCDRVSYYFFCAEMIDPCVSLHVVSCWNHIACFASDNTYSNGAKRMIREFWALFFDVRQNFHLSNGRLRNGFENSFWKGKGNMN